MSEKKTTRKKSRAAATKTTATQRGGKRRATARAAEPTHETEAIQKAETGAASQAAETGTALTDAPAAPRGRRRGGRKAAQAAEAATSAAPTTPAGPEVIEEDGAVVVRFPPVAPPPFSLPPRAPTAAPAAAAAPAPEAPAARAVPPEPAEPSGLRSADAASPPAPPARSAAPATHLDQHRGPRELRREEPRDDRRAEDRERPADPQRRRGETPPPSPPSDAGPQPGGPGGGERLLTEDEERRLSPSQKRRLRRRRRRERALRGNGGVTAGTAAPDRPVAASDERGLEIDADDAERHIVERTNGLDGPSVEVADAPDVAADVSAAAGGEPDWYDEVPREVVVAEGETEGAAGSDTGLAVAEPETEGRRERRGRRRRGRDRDRGRGRDSDVGAGPPRLEVVEIGEGPGELSESRGRREMIINAVPREECRIAILKDGKLEEIYLERATLESYVGNIYKGVVTNVEPSIQAAFIDFGQGKNGFLHISDLHPQYFPDGAGQTENVGHKLPRRHRPPIQRCLRRGQEVLVQVTKEGIGTKGPTLTTYLSIPGRFLVMMPGMRRLGVSRRIEDDAARNALREVLSELELPEGMGFIARTAALGRPKKEVQNDLNYLTRLWRAVEKRIKNEPAPAELYRESDLVIRTIRDAFTSDVERIIVDDAEVAQRAREFLSIFSPRSEDIVTLYEDPMPIFHKYGIEAELERLHSRHVPLKSGGSLVIDQTEALVAIDVNSGRFRTEDDAETTAFKIDLEAADEIPRQLRLRDLGGVIVCDFIDLRQEAHRREVERRLIKNLKEHKERAKVLRMSAFGIIELTRQRQRASLTRSVYQDCRHCRGTGLVKTVESVALDVMRLIQLAVSREHIATVEVSVSPDVAYLLQNRKRRLIADLEQKFRRTVSIRPEPNYSLDQVEIRCTDARGRLVPYT